MSRPDPGQMLAQMVPFVRPLGLRIAPVTTPGTAQVTLPSATAVHNHLGTAHAGAAYTAAETASGAAALSVFGDVVAQGAYVALKSSTVTHRKARAGDVLAVAKLGDDPRALRTQWTESGKVDFTVTVELSVEDTPTATMTFVWAVRKPR